MRRVRLVSLGNKHLLFKVVHVTNTDTAIAKDALTIVE